ncbi:Trk K+ transport system NAD-binding subunit [Plantactinospora soyae]|uniref:Trk K+ transport system NAD-binding subunit n=1 Tax=Plantactinospora soyae TaxID=1544732 RepID=A0A927QXE3_9ACTN|nr:NAD-binding protein [Plantactinospora soyae]MBE1486617.1 Trk K+ transport system NAD-binding subunit [Plantactinospora soyae]
MADLWRTRARRAFETRLRDGLRTNGDNRPHYVICGQDALAVHLVEELLGNDPQGNGVRVTVIVPNQRRQDGPDIRSIRGVRSIQADRLDEETFRAAGLVGASGLALLHQDDVGNIHAALCAQEVEPDLRVVLRMFNMNLGNGIRQLFPNSAVLSDASMAAPAFVAAALGEVAPTYFRHGGRTLHVAPRTDVRPEHVICGLADTQDPHHPLVLPADESSADLVLAEATGQVGPELATRRWLLRSRRGPRRRISVLFRAMRSFATRKIGMATISVLGVVVVLGFLLSFAEETSIGNALYLTMVTTIVGADPDIEKGAAAQVLQVVLNLAGLALIPLITAAVVDGIVKARLALDAGALPSERNGHVVVVGLGNVGTRVMWQLNDLGVEVVAIDKDPEARGAAVARRLNVPLIIGDVAREETLDAASVGTCQSLVVVSTDDVSNLQAALHGRALRADLRVVLRLFDGDFAQRIQKTFKIGISRSVSYLAAPSFSAALLNRAVIATIPIARHALLVAEVPIMTGANLAGQQLRVVSQAEWVRVIAVTRAGQPRTEWALPPEQRLRPGDRLTVVVRRAGLNRLLREASTPPPHPPHGTDGPDQAVRTGVPRQSGRPGQRDRAGDQPAQPVRGTTRSTVARPLRRTPPTL